jgi:hypothetical protein
MRRSQKITIANLSQKDWVTPTVISDLQDDCNFVSNAWGLKPVALSLSDTDCWGWRLYVLDEPAPEGILGYHKTRWGTPISYVYAGDCAAAGAVLSTVIAHELAEMLGDPSADIYVDMPNGKRVARELCDPVQADFFTVGETLVCNFVNPSYFDPQGQAPYDYLNQIKVPFAMTGGGYMIIDNGYVFADKLAFLKQRCTRRAA